MRRTKSWIIGIACGVLCAVCVLVYLQDASAQIDAVRAEALERFGGEQVEVCVAKRDIAAGEVVDASSFEKRMWVTALLPEDPLTQDSGDLDGAERRGADFEAIRGVVIFHRCPRRADRRQRSRARCANGRGRASSGDVRRRVRDGLGGNDAHRP